MQNRPQPVTLMLVALVGVLWGLNFPAVKFMLGDVPPFTLRAAGFTGGAVILLVMVRALGHCLMPQRAEVLPIIAAGLFVLFGFNILTALGQQFLRFGTPAAPCHDVLQALICPVTCLGLDFLGPVLQLTAGFLQARVVQRLFRQPPRQPTQAGGEAGQLATLACFLPFIPLGFLP